MPSIAIASTAIASITIVMPAIVSIAEACGDVVEVEEESHKAGRPVARRLHAATATATAIAAATATAIAIAIAIAVAIEVVVDASEAGGESPQLLVQKGGVAVRCEAAMLSKATLTMAVLTRC